MLNVINEFARGCLAIRVSRKLKAPDLIDVLSDLFGSRGVPRPYPLGRRTWVHCQGRSWLNHGGEIDDRLQRAKQSVRKRLLQELQRFAAG